jgi:hypothetical protein
MVRSIAVVVFLGWLPASAHAWQSPTFYFNGLNGNGGVSTRWQYSNTSNLNVTIRSTYFTRNGQYQANQIVVTLYRQTWYGYAVHGQQRVDANGGGTVRWNNVPTGSYFVNVNLANAPNYGSYASGSGWMSGS